jgi:hypothetical protein
MYSDARELNRQGIKCYWKPWAHRQVVVMVTNPKYAGYRLESNLAEVSREDPTHTASRVDHARCIRFDYRQSGVPSS